jgi:hypothetical protein
MLKLRSQPMKSIMLVFLVLSTLFFSGCQFSFMDGGFVDKKENPSVKVGAIATDLMFDNALNEFIEFEEKQRREEDLKEQGIILGIRFVKRF